MLPSLLEALARFALSVSIQVVIVAVGCIGIAVVTASTEQVLVLALLAAYLATAVLLTSLAAPELAFVVMLIGIFVSLMMQFTAIERRQVASGAAHAQMSLAFRLLVVLVLLWLAWSLNLFARPLDASRFALLWLVASAGAALAISSDPFKVGIALLMLLASGLLYYATSTSEASLFVLGVIAVASFAVSLASSHLALIPPAEADR
ncbi:MAG: hypothetical protein ACUVWR_02040 [Anaerolineae bacterium]